MIGVILGAVVGFWYSHAVTQSKLEINGSGTGSSGGLVQTQLQVSNNPRFVGLQIGRTIVLGKPLHRGVSQGIIVERVEAKQCTARLIEAESHEHLAQLWWDPTGVPADYKTVVSIPCGTSVSLKLFARRESDVSAYFVFDPDGNGVPKVPSEDMWFRGNKKFLVEIAYSNGKTLRFHVTVRKSYGGPLYVEHLGGNGSF